VRAYRKQHIVTAAYVCCVLFITLFSREMNLLHKIEWIPLWSVFDWISTGSDYGSSFFLNIALFIPLGYFFAEQTNTSGEKNHSGIAVPVIQCLALSLVIEVTQFISY
jgi:glycopeptide antibiotics resistance protein